MIIIFSGNIGQFAIGGNAWVNMHYLLGLHELGHNVFYLEECGEGSLVYNWEAEEITTDLNYPTTNVRGCLRSIGFDGQCLYRAGKHSVGMPLDAFRSILSKADILIVLASSLDTWREDYDWTRRRIYIDLDPDFTQVRLASGDLHLTNTVKRCKRLCNIGQRIYASHCTIPAGDRRWLTAVVPISLSLWTGLKTVSSAASAPLCSGIVTNKSRTKGCSTGILTKNFLTSCICQNSRLSAFGLL